MIILTGLAYAFILFCCGFLLFRVAEHCLHRAYPEPLHYNLDVDLACVLFVVNVLFAASQWLVYNGGLPIVPVAATLLNVWFIGSIGYSLANPDPLIRIGMTRRELLREAAFGLVFGAAALYMLYGQLA